MCVFSRMILKNAPGAVFFRMILETVFFCYFCKKKKTWSGFVILELLGQQNQRRIGQIKGHKSQISHVKTYIFIFFQRFWSCLGTNRETNRSDKKVKMSNIICKNIYFHFFSDTQPFKTSTFDMTEGKFGAMCGFSRVRFGAVRDVIVGVAAGGTRQNTCPINKDAKTK